MSLTARLALLIALFSIIGSGNSIRCYHCVYIENFCGLDCEKSSGDEHLYAEIKEQDTPGEVLQPTCLTGARGGNVTLPVSSSPKGASMDDVWYPYCVKEVRKSAQEDSIFRYHIWMRETDRDGSSDKSKKDGITYEWHFCNNDKCNDACPLAVSLLGVGLLLVIGALLK